MFTFLLALGLRCWVQTFSGCQELGLIFVAVRGLLTVVASLIAEHRLQVRGFSHCSSWAQQLWCMWLVAPWHVEPSWTSNQTCVPCTGRRIPVLCTTREVLQCEYLLFKKNVFVLKKVQKQYIAKGYVYMS